MALCTKCIESQNLARVRDHPIVQNAERELQRVDARISALTESILNPSLRSHRDSTEDHTVEVHEALLFNQAESNAAFSSRSKFCSLCPAAVQNEWTTFYERLDEIREAEAVIIESVRSWPRDLESDESLQLIETLTQARTSLYLFLKSKLSELAIDALPPEILSEIFLHFGKTQLHPNILTLKNSPLILEHVCRKWRAIAIGTPRLWTTIGVRMDSSSTYLFPEYVELWLKRSRPHPLSVYLSSESDVDWQTHPGFAAVLHHHQRWESLEVCVPSYTTLLESFRWVQDGIPLLKSLRLSVDTPFSTNEVPIEFFHNAPKLEEVKLGYNLPLSALKLPYHQLARFASMSSYTIQDCLSVFRQGKAVRECSLKLATNNPLSNHVLTRSQHLQCLKISPWYGEELFGGKFFENLHAPSLRELEIRFLQASCQTQFIAFLSRGSGSNITKLDLRGVSLVNDGLVAVLIETPKLRELVVWEILPRETFTINSNVLKTLSEINRHPRGDSPEPALCPGLEYLDLFVGLLFEEDVFADFIAIRVGLKYCGRIGEPVGSGMKRVKLRMRRGVDEAVVRRLSMYKDFGLHVSIDEISGTPRKWL